VKNYKPPRKLKNFSQPPKGGDGDRKVRIFLGFGNFG